MASMVLVVLCRAAAATAREQPTCVMIVVSSS